MNNVPNPSCRGKHPVAGDQGCRNEACKGISFCVASCTTCPDIFSLPDCQGGHTVDGPGNGCNDDRCRGKTYCVRECTGCPFLPGKSSSAAAAAAPTAAETAPLLPFFIAVEPPNRRVLTLMNFNIWISGSKGPGGLPAAAAAIASCSADIICLQESSAAATHTILAQLQQLSPMLYRGAVASGNAGIISRFPIAREVLSDSIRRGWAVDVVLPVGMMMMMKARNGGAASSARPSPTLLRVINSHLQPYPYGPYTVRDGASVEETLQGETVRTEQAEAIMQQFVRGNDSNNNNDNSDMPIVFCGDHNSPSHLDWTNQNAEQHFGVSVPWPVSEVCAREGFHDLFRAVHPDPVMEPGCTWTCGAPKRPAAEGGPVFEEREVHDRIDFVYFKPAPGTSFSVLQAYAFDHVQPWPSDHRAVVASILFGAPPTFLAANKNENER